MKTYFKLFEEPPTRDKAWRLEIPSSQGQMMTTRYYKPEETADISFGIAYDVSASPNTREIFNNRPIGNFPLETATTKKVA